MIKKVFHIGVVASLMVAVNLAWAAGSTELRGLRVVATPVGTQVTLDLTSVSATRSSRATCGCLSETELCRDFGSGRSRAARCVLSCS
jgi:hypothetical protein